MKLFLVANFVFPPNTRGRSIAGFAKWFVGDAQPEDSMVWLALSIAGLGLAATHFDGFIRPVHCELAAPRHPVRDRTC